MTGSSRRSAAELVTVVTTGLMALTLSRPCFAENPIIQTKFTADPAPLVHGDRLYLYTSHDDDNATGFTMYDWMLYSTTDMVNWTDHGIVAGVRAPNKTFAWADGNNAWAPQATFRNGKFYLYVPTPKGGRMVIGVAVADQPAGPFVDAIGAPLIDDPTSTTGIDPSVMIDDDGQAYLYFGHQPQLYYVKLNADMISYSGKIEQVTRPQTFEEGPWIYRRDNRYYLAFASTCCPEGIGYATSTNPMGPWSYKGSIMDGNPASSGNHPGIVDYKGHSYVFGFNYALNLMLTDAKRERRSICVQEFSYGSDGAIAKLPFWVSTGVSQLENLDPFAQVEAETMAWSEGLKTEACAEGGMDVTAIQAGDFIELRGVDFGAGATSLQVRIAAATAGGAIEARLDGKGGKLIGSCAVPQTGGPQSWMTVSCDITGAEGLHDLYFVFAGASGSAFNFNWWKFVGPGGEAPNGTAGTAPGGSGGSAGAGEAGAGGGSPSSGGAGGKLSAGGGEVDSTSGGSGSASGSGGAATAGASAGALTMSGTHGLTTAPDPGCACGVKRRSSHFGALASALAVASIAAGRLRRRYLRPSSTSRIGSTRYVSRSAS